ncbi:hypothetical protein BKA56DRAFT_285397 [Ilyonectria sp. MPI-CAGE-AT-0026]|nr:hypothetical protein BKA56DRAFT_285397 [Ilyonectria sp. MPI-CAGE-AT-0026]
MLIVVSGVLSFGQPVYPPDATAFSRSLKSYEGKVGDLFGFQARACDTWDFVRMSPELCKFTRCDWGIPKYPSGNSSADIEILYQKELHLQHERALLNKAREMCLDRSSQVAQTGHGGCWRREGCNLAKRGATCSCDMGSNEAEYTVLIPGY